MDKNKRKKIILISIAAALLLLVAILFWRAKCGPTRIAFVNYQITTLGQIAKSNNNSFVKIKEVSLDELDKLSRYDMVFVNGMGLRITAEQRQTILDVAAKVPVMTVSATNPDNYILSVDEATEDTLLQYLGSPKRANYASLLNYVRTHIDGKILAKGEINPVVPASNSLLFHADPSDPDAENLEFNSIDEYVKFLKKSHLYNAGAPGVIVTGVMGEPADLVKKLEETGNMVFPVRNMNTLIAKGHADSVQANAVINMAHGRMGDLVDNYLKQRNIPLFITLYVPQLTSQWETDKQGMSGGFLSQSVVVPEIDGGIRPYVVFAHRTNSDGLQEIYAIPERLEAFVQTVNNYIALKTKPNRDKKVAIYYYKGVGQNSLTAAGMEVLPSLYNLLLKLQSEGYRVENLPASPDDLGRLIQRQGSVLGTYAEGAFEDFMKNGNPELITKKQYDEWSKKALRQASNNEVRAAYGDFPGHYLATSDGRLAVARLQFGNVALLPQPMAGLGDNSFQIVHGTDACPPYTYIASYLWARYGFQADAIIHFGTHGSLEFTPRKQVALSSNDWPDRLMGSTPHFYIYSIGNVGESMIAKRRSYATLVSCLTPPFTTSDLRGEYRELSEAIKSYYQAYDAKNQNLQRQLSLKVKRLAVKFGIHRSLELDSSLAQPYPYDDITRIDNFAEELATEKITGRMYTMGVPYDDKDIRTSVFAMTTDPIAYSLLALDKMRGKARPDAEKHKSTFSSRYLIPAQNLVNQLLNGSVQPSDALVCKTAGITANELQKAREVAQATAPKDLMSMMMQMGQGGSQPVQSSGGKAVRPASHPTSLPPGMSGKTALKLAKLMGAPPEALKKMEAALNGEPAPDEPSKQHAKPDTSAQATSPMAQMISAMMGGHPYTSDEIALSRAIMEVERSITNVGRYKSLLQQSPQLELQAVVNALGGGFVEPSPGGDPIVNPNTLPTGRNLYGVNAENTPSELAWEKGKALAQQTIDAYRQRHNDSLPNKVSYTLWSGEFIETEGATIAQILYMLGVEPVRDPFGRVTDLRLIPSEELGRPRIDVVVQTSGQLRDLASSRLFLINRAVNMAAQAKDDKYENRVAAGVLNSEKVLIDKGVSPKEARQMSSYRVFGGVNGGYGTGIQAMVQAGDRWDKESEIAEVYLNNMGAFYGDEAEWENMRQYAFEAALANTDAVVQPRQSNTWGALSLDHVYEFMGGLNLAVRNVTGKDPDAYLSDYRNRNNFRMQEVKEAIGVESRTTLFNPKFISEKMKGGASEANTFAELIQNTYGWNVMKPKAVDNEMWDEVYNVYVKDKFDLGVQNYFETTNPAALEEMTAVMMETARKGMWKATPQQLSDIAKLHTHLVNKYKPSCSGFVCDNAKLQQFITNNVDQQVAADYSQNIRNIRETSATASKQGMVMKKDQLNSDADQSTHLISGILVGVGVAIAVALLVLLVRKRRKGLE